MLSRYYVKKGLFFGGLGIIGLGFILGIVLAFQDNYLALGQKETHFYTSVMLEWWMKSFTYGGVLLGIHSIIQILEERQSSSQPLSNQQSYSPNQQPYNSNQPFHF